MNMIAPVIIRFVSQGDVVLSLSRNASVDI